MNFLRALWSKAWLMKELRLSMNKQEFFNYHKQFCEDIRDISQKKNADYTGSNPCPFANFTAVERNGIATTEQGFLTRMMDKIQRINSYAQQGKLEVVDEKVEDTLMDLANYCILFSAYIKSKQEASLSQLSLPWFVDSKGIVTIPE
jgi:uncharacterized protein YnzC (UPF0291/DUF896 family)